MVSVGAKHFCYKEEITISPLCGLFEKASIVGQ